MNHGGYGMSNYNFSTIEDVKSHMDFFQDYEFGGEASFGGFCDYVWEHHSYMYYDCFDNDDNNGDEQTNEMMRDYLLSVEEKLGDYDF